MTGKIFWVDPYCAVLDTTVSSVNGNEVILSETIFYGFSGGQESDAGTIANLSVLGARLEGADVVYTLGDGHGLKSGDAVRVEIDWTRRYALMRLHFAAELVLDRFYKTLSGVEKVGAHIAQDKARLDFALGESIAPLLSAIAEEVNAIIESDYPIVSAFEDGSLERRYWEIKDLARVSCGGTHLRRAGEVGKIRLKRNNIGRGKERVDIFLT